MAGERQQLDEAQAGTVWVSKLTGALYRWNEGWEVKTTLADWHPVKLGQITFTVYGVSGESFVSAT